MKRIFVAVLCVAMILTISTITAFATNKDSSVLAFPEDDGTGYPVKSFWVFLKAVMCHLILRNILKRREA